MKNLTIASLACVASAFSSLALAAPGEYWEVTSKMEMAGMPFAMPAQSMKVCIARGSEKNPPPDKDCETSDVKVSGNKTFWKVRCNRNGEIMNGSGEMSGNVDKSEGTMHLSGKSGGQDVNMTLTHQSKRIGGACDSDEMANKMKAQGNKMKEQVCDTSKFKKTTDWIGSASLFLNDQTCPGKKEPLCDAVRRDAPRDVSVYQYLAMTEKNNGGLVAKGCGLNMAAITATQCKSINASSVNALSAYCPAEAKAYREAARRKACEGRSYTAKANLDKCLSSGATMEDEDTPVKSQARATKAPNATGVVNDAAEEQEFKGNASKSKPAAPSAGDAVMDGAKKLKGLFGL
jgi:hypothetical protein